jgi:integrase
MTRTIVHKRIETPTARAKLKRGNKTHYQSLVAGKASLGYTRKDDAPHGRWFLRRYIGGERYAIIPLGAADDEKGMEADGATVLSFDQAKDKALKELAHGGESVPRGTLTVRKAFAKYIEFLESQGKRTHETERRAAALILPELGDLKVADLTSERLRKWLSGLVTRPALLRSKKGGKQNTKAKPEDDEAIRKRRSSANRVLTMLKAALNYAYDEKWVSNNEAWGRRLKPFKGVDEARLRYLQIEEAKRLLNVCDPRFRMMVQSALETGCRYSELCRLVVSDFNRDAGTIGIRKSKSHKARHVILSPEGANFFAQITAGRSGGELMLHNFGRVERALEKERKKLEKQGKDPNKARVDDEGEWRSAEQGRPMSEACSVAKIDPPISINGMRHTWASHSVMNGVPLMVVAKNLGHKDTRMVEKHYGHLAPGFVADAIRKGAPRFGFKADKRVAMLKAA